MQLSEEQIETILDAWKEFESVDFQYASSDGEIHELGQQNAQRHKCTRPSSSPLESLLDL